MTRGVRFCLPVRNIAPDGWEAFCGTCRAWWPLDLAYWYATISGGRCRACHNMTDRERQRIARANDEHKRAVARDRARRYRESWTDAQRLAVRDKNRAYIAAHRVENAAKCRARRERLRRDKAA